MNEEERILNGKFEELEGERERSKQKIKDYKEKKEVELADLKDKYELKEQLAK